MLGHHLDRPSVSALTYGRQNFVPVLKKLDKVIIDISNGSFRPDARASVLVSHQILEEEAASEKFEKAMQPLERCEDSASEVEDAEDLEISAQAVVPAADRRDIRLVDAHTYEQHRLSGSVHKIKSGTHFLCGRVRSLNYIEAEEHTILGCYLCEQCKSVMKTHQRRTE